MRLLNFAGMLVGLTPLFDEPGDGGSGGGAGAAGTGNAGASTGDGAKPAASGSGTPDAGAKPVAGGTPAGKFEDDPRFKGVIADLAKERKARQRYEADITATRAQLDAERRRVQALAGVTPRSEQDQADEAVIQRLKQLNVPRSEKLANLSDEQIDKLLSVIQNADQFERATTHHWESHASKMLEATVSSMQKALGGDLTDRQRNRLEQLYAVEARNNPEFLRRHELGDTTLIDEFVKEFVEDFVEPGRRKALADEQTRMRRVPSSRDRSVIGQGGKKFDLSKDEDFAEAVAASFKSHGGAFGER